MDTEESSTDDKKHSLQELRGLGADLWESVDAQAYIDSLRSEWDERELDQDRSDAEAQ